MANRALLSAQIIKDIILTGIHIEHFKYDAGGPLKIYSCNDISDDQLDELNNLVEYINRGVDFIREDSNIIWATF